MLVARVGEEIIFFSCPGQIGFVDCVKIASRGRVEDIHVRMLLIYVPKNFVVS
jgi:hypothetical protein